MIDDERCRRVMNKFRKRRRERIFNEANSLSEDSTSIASSYCSRRRKRDTDDDSDDGGNLFDGDKRKTNFSATSNCFGSSFLFPSSRKHINYRKNWGENIARRRAFTNNDNNDNNDDSYHHHRHQDNHNHNTKINTQTTILPEIIHRKPESIHNASSYNRCLFLDSYDKVMGIDSDGTLDVIQLGDIRYCSVSSPTDNISSNITTTTNTSRGSSSSSSSPSSLSSTHKKIATEFEFGAELRQQQFSDAHVVALNGGSTIAFGIGNGNLYLLDLEYGDERKIRCCRKNDFCKNHKDTITIPLSSTVVPSSSSSSIFRAYQTQNPQRKYYRDRRCLSIQELIRHELCNDYGTNNNLNNSYNNNISELHPIDSATGRVPSPVRFIPGFRPSQYARWDMLEVAPSLLHVAHIDSDYDAFWMQILDGRARSAANFATTTTTTNSDISNNTSTVLIDSSSRDNPGTSEEHITACCHVSDICMATSHIYCGNHGSTPAGEFFDRDLPYAGHGMSSCIKLWDIRMVKKNVSRSNSKSSLSSSIPVDTIPVSSSSTLLFRHADVALVKPVAQVNTELTSGNGTLAFSRATFVDDEGSDKNIVETNASLRGSDFVITNLSGGSARDPTYGSSTNNGSTRGVSLVVTTQSRTKSTRIEHCQMDLSNLQMTRKVFQTNTNLGCPPLYAVSSSSNVLVTYSNRSHSNTLGGNTSRILIYDISASSFDEEYIATREDGCSLHQIGSHRQQLEDPSWSFQMNASLTDRYDMETELSCIAMNTNGTALLGGSTDGDLFVWRGI